MRGKGMKIPTKKREPTSLIFLLIKPSSGLMLPTIRWGNDWSDLFDIFTIVVQHFLMTALQVWNMNSRKKNDGSNLYDVFAAFHDRITNMKQCFIETWSPDTRTMNQVFLMFWPLSSPNFYEAVPRWNVDLEQYWSWSCLILRISCNWCLKRSQFCIERADLSISLPKKTKSPESPHVLTVPVSL